MTSKRELPKGVTVEFEFIAERLLRQMKGAVKTRDANALRRVFASVEPRSPESFALCGFAGGYLAQDVQSYRWIMSSLAIVNGLEDIICEIHIANYQNHSNPEEWEDAASIEKPWSTPQ